MKIMHTERRSKKSGLPPGSIVYVGKEKAGPVLVSLIDYDKDALEEKSISDITTCSSYKDKESVTWINIEGVHDLSIVKQVGKTFDLHPLLLEDVVNTEQRPKVDAFDDYLFIVLKMLAYDLRLDAIVVEQVSIVLSKKCVILFQEPGGDVFDTLRERIRNPKSRLRKEDNSYLAYSIIDTIVDNYFFILEKLNEKIDELSDKIISNPTQDVPIRLHALKRQMLFLRKSIWPLRDVLNLLLKEHRGLLSEPTLFYLRDVLDHTVQVIDNLEVMREMLSALLEVYLSKINMKTNDVIKVLTVIATIFMPITFVASIYGMNFHYMPELHWPWGYTMAWSVMIMITIMMLIYFKRKKWI